MSHLGVVMSPKPFYFFSSWVHLRLELGLGHDPSHHALGL